MIMGAPWYEGQTEVGRNQGKMGTEAGEAQPLGDGVQPGVEHNLSSYYCQCTAVSEDR